MDAELYKVLRLRPTDILVLRIPEKLRPEALDKTAEAVRGKLEAAGVTVADVWILDGGTEVEVIAIEDVPE